MKILTKTIILLMILTVIIFSASSFCKSIQKEAYNSGISEGKNVLIKEIIEFSEDCNAVPLVYGNQTVTLIDNNCE
ncbi:hypothetical protein KY321_02365 [Candidatus Woesearchaeota archaeon]|nr:hypothetical protein [Candidatus Woesearchaeota archaeon]